MVISEGLRWGVVMSVLAIALAVLGLTPALSWVPELPLLTAAVLLPIFAYGLAGHRAGLRSGRLLGGLLAGALAGGISGAVGGACYVVFGKSAFNLLAGFGLGVIGGAAVGTVGALIALRRRPGIVESNRGKSL
ncbi:MAG: hypothetical protein DLM67_00330 [Candidatus Nephthysia bennettiae]|uniref:Uncharacterized protein n=1 Tax=Candidatus Nephthysia bennettiae TaxID=3127016 RepID=A0A934JZZ3_9BACT|nr:hypothetical protein [Candidatus Dormibacteraeota bacterium]MBJ7613315.1 hypothetical protein [Candidatus Dormibacteraeota bacterium]PZS00909.1 MAG: hypothetical protein DLM67_00330 [Candidatus Dormibacteraeota bacterium]